jgi:hypothetical protein
MRFFKRFINPLLILLILLSSSAPLYSAQLNKATGATIGLGNVINTLHKVDATAAPTPDNDTTENYSIGSLWYHVDEDKVWTCVDASATSAVWLLLDANNRFVNKTGSTLDKGDVVYYDGADAVGSLTTVDLANANSEATSATTAGFVLEDTLNNEKGYLISKGPVNGYNTNSWSLGDSVWLATTDGQATNTIPPAPNHSVFLGIVTKVHATQGIIAVNVQNGHESYEMHDVRNIIPSITGQILRWDNPNSYYDLGYLPDAFSGVVSWDGSGDYYDEAFPDGEFRLLRAGTGSIKSEAVTWTAPQDTGVLSSNTTNYVYIDSAGDIQTTTTRTNALYGDNVVLFIVLYDGTNYEPITDAHPAEVPWQTSNDLHDTLGTVFEKGDQGVLERVTTGTGSVATDRQVKQVSASEIHDHGLEADFADSSGSGVSIKHYYTDGSGNWLRDSNGTEFPMKYNSAGIPTAITTNRFGVFRVYYSKDDLNTAGGKRFTVMHTAEFTTQVGAQTAINNGEIVIATNELTALEMAQYGFVIVKNTAAGGHVIEIDTIKDVAGGSITQSGGSNLASAINTDTTNFDGGLSASDTTAQAAFETLDDKTAAASTTTAGIIEVATSAETDTGTDATRAVSPDALAGSNLGIRYVAPVLAGWTTEATTGDGKFYIHVPAAFDGMNLVEVHAEVITAGTTGTLNLDIYNVTQAADMLSTNVTIDSGETGSDTAATPPVIDTANDDVAENDLIRIDIDAVHTTASKGGPIFTMGFQLP